MSYTPIASQTLASDTATITFSSIPNTYRDLILTVTGKVATNLARPFFRINNDSGNNYVVVTMEALASGSYDYTSSLSYFAVADNTALTLDRTFYVENNFIDYANTGKWKNVSGFQASLEGASKTSSRWSSTSAINRIDIFPSSGNFRAGSVFALYGVI